MARRTRRRGGRRSKRAGRKRRRQRGGFSGTQRLSPGNVPTFPPGGIYNPKSITNGLGKGFYYGQNMRPTLQTDILKTNNKGMNKPIKGGRRKRRGGRRRTRTRRGGRRRTRTRRGGRRRRRTRGGRRRRRTQRGGGSLVELIPGGTDTRDVVWQTLVGGKNAVNTWRGAPKEAGPLPVENQYQSRLPKGATLSPAPLELSSIISKSNASVASQFGSP